MTSTHLGLSQTCLMLDRLSELPEEIRPEWSPALFFLILGSQVESNGKRNSKVLWKAYDCIRRSIDRDAAPGDVSIRDYVQTLEEASAVMRRAALLSLREEIQATVEKKTPRASRRRRESLSLVERIAKREEKNYLESHSADADLQRWLGHAEKTEVN